MGYTLPGNISEIWEAYDKLSRKDQIKCTKKAILHSLKGIDSHWGLKEAGRLISEYKELEKEEVSLKKKKK